MLSTLFKNNQEWVKRVTREDPDFFSRLAQQQTPDYLWIGCSDSRVPANQIVGLEPGQMFVHRNIANVVAHTDLNCLSVLQFAIDVLKIRHVMIVGHYGCSGVRAALESTRVGLADNWLRHVQDVTDKHYLHLNTFTDREQQLNRLCELNVIEQAFNVCKTTVVQDAWERGQSLAIHGWIYGLADGLLRDLNITIASRDALAQKYQELHEQAEFISSQTLKQRNNDKVENKKCCN